MPAPKQTGQDSAAVNNEEAVKQIWKALVEETIAAQFAKQNAEKLDPMANSIAAVVQGMQGLRTEVKDLRERVQKVEVDMVSNKADNDAAIKMVQQEVRVEGMKWAWETEEALDREARSVAARTRTVLADSKQPPVSDEHMQQLAATMGAEAQVSRMGSHRLKVELANHNSAAAERLKTAVAGLGRPMQVRGYHTPMELKRLKLYGLFVNGLTADVKQHVTFKVERGKVWVHQGVVDIKRTPEGWVVYPFWLHALPGSTELCNMEADLILEAAAAVLLPSGGEDKGEGRGSGSSTPKGMDMEMPGKGKRMEPPASLTPSFNGAPNKMRSRTQSASGTDQQQGGGGAGSSGANQSDTGGGSNNKASSSKAPSRVPANVYQLIRGPKGK